MDRWAFQQLDPWLQIRRQLPVGSLFCVVRGPTRGRPCSTPAIRVQLRDTAAKAGVRRRFAPHQLRHAHAVEMSRGCPAGRHPTPTRTRQSRGHVRVSARDRQHRDHPHRPRTPRPGDLRLQRASHQPLNSTAPPPPPLTVARAPRPSPAAPGRVAKHASRGGTLAMRKHKREQPLCRFRGARNRGGCERAHGHREHDRRGCFTPIRVTPTRRPLPPKLDNTGAGASLLLAREQR
jgi:hypothetical protein